jgi:hypothetical protein
VKLAVIDQVVRQLEQAAADIDASDSPVLSITVRIGPVEDATDVKLDFEGNVSVQPQRPPQRG